jgi:hypothetical protein
MRALFAVCATSVLIGTSFGATPPPSTETLVTPNYKVVVTRSCAKNETVCSKLSARIKSKDGRDYLLGRGSPYIATGADGKPAGPVLGYRFRHKTTDYLALENGEFQIIRRGKQALKEQGSWSR